MVAQQVGDVFGKGGKQFSAHDPFRINLAMFGNTPCLEYSSMIKQ